MAHMPITNRTLKTALPTIVPMPTSDWETKTPLKKLKDPEKIKSRKLPIIEVNNSGALPPAAIKVAPATSSVMSSLSIITCDLWLRAYD